MATRVWRCRSSLQRPASPLISLQIHDEPAPCQETIEGARWAAVSRSGQVTRLDRAVTAYAQRVDAPPLLATCRPTSPPAIVDPRDWKSHPLALDVGSMALSDGSGERLTPPLPEGYELNPWDVCARWTNMLYSLPIGGGTPHAARIEGGQLLQLTQATDRIVGAPVFSGERAAVYLSRQANIASGTATRLLVATLR